MNNSSTETDLFTTPIEYISFGSVAILTNLLILFIVIRNARYFKKSAFITGLAVGDLIEGFALVLNGSVRIVAAFNRTSFIMVHPFYCMKTLVQPIFLLGNQIPGVMFFLIGVERFLAVCCFEWYYIKWTNQLAWMLTACAYGVSVCSIGAGFGVAASYASNYTISIACYTQSATGPTYSVYNYSVAIVGGMIAVVTTITAMVVLTQRKARLVGATHISTGIKSHVKRQWILTRMALCLAVVDFGFLVVPSILVTLSSWFVNTSLGTASLRTWPLQLVSFRSILNIIIYLLINSEFRDATKLAFGLKNHVSPLFLSNILNQHHTVMRKHEHAL